MTRNTLVLGAAVSGRAAAGLAARLGDTVTIFDHDGAAIAGLDEQWTAVSGAWDASLLDDQDLVVTSPGIPPHAAPVVDSLASGIEFISEMEFGYRHLAVPCAAVTGTNGKTTVTRAAAEMLSVAGLDAVAAGNIGRALSDVVGAEPDVVVVEASSFQLRFIDRFHASAAALLNLAPDHLDWHGTAAEYVAAKIRIGEQQDSDDIIVFDVDDPGATAAVAGMPARHLPVSGRSRPGGGNGPEGDTLWVGDVALPRPDLDRAFTVDLTAAATLAQHMGASAEALAKVIAGFVPELHRRTLIGTWDQVAWVNDSKATNPHAAVAAAEAYESVVLIAGGRNKGLDLDPLPLVPSVRTVIAIGEATDELAAATSPGDFSAAESLEHAVELADAAARPGDTVLLAPGCASFDMFRDYQERGRVFTDLVLLRKGS